MIIVNRMMKAVPTSICRGFLPMYSEMSMMSSLGNFLSSLQMSRVSRMMSRVVYIRLIGVPVLDCFMISFGMFSRILLIMTISIKKMASIFPIFKFMFPPF